MATIFKENYLKYHDRETQFQDEFIKQVFDEMPNNVGLIIDKKEDRIASCAMFLTGSGSLWLYKVGQNENEAANTSSLFVTAIYESIKMALERGYGHIDLGSGAYRYKLLRGAEIQPMYHYVKKSNPLANFGLKILFDKLSKRKLRKHYAQVKGFIKR